MTFLFISIEAAPFCIIFIRILIRECKISNPFFVQKVPRKIILTKEKDDITNNGKSQSVTNFKL